MADSKIDFSFENLHFSCEGENTWVERQLNNVLSRIPALLSVHRKGENIVEEVIDVEEEEVDEVKPNAPHASKKAAKAPKEKADKIVKEKTSKVKSAREPKVKVAREAKTAKARTSGVVKETIEGESVKRGRKPKGVAKSAAKAKLAKKKVAKASPVTDPDNSPLFQYIKEKKVISNQVRKFLATAVFLARNNNLTKLSTPMISRALKINGIEKLQNASDCLNKNEKKGYCTKEGKEFIITENGFLSIE